MECIHGGRVVNNELQYTNGDNITFKDSYVIYGRKRRFKDKEYASAELLPDKGWFTNGRIEFRAMLPKG